MNTLLALAITAILAIKPAQNVRVERSFSLTDRYSNPWVNDVFRYNILHTLTLMNSKTYSFTLNPGDVFAFHEDVLPQFEGKVVASMHAHFNFDEGFKSDGYLTGDGVCHLASLMYWAARDAGLSALAPTNHNFATIPDVPKEDGVSILASDPNQNLYITNTLITPVRFVFAFDDTRLTVKVIDLGVGVKS